MDGSSIVFLGESSINIGMTRLYGRAYGVERVIDYVPDVSFDRLSILSSMCLDGILVPLTYKGTLDGTLFFAYVTQFLIPAINCPLLFQYRCAIIPSVGAEWSSPVARRAHNPKVVGSNPASAR